MFFQTLHNLCFYLNIFTVLCFVNGAPISDETQNGNLPTTYLSINPRNHQLEVNWLNIDLSSMNETTLMVTDGPITNVSLDDFLGASRWTIGNGTELLFDMTLNSTEGRQQTHLKHNFGEHRRMDLDTGCYKYWIHLIVGNAVTSSRCHRTNAFWMSEMRKQLETRKIRQLFIPGTHDSSSYKYNFDPTQMETLVSRYTLTQDDDVSSQLLHGIRYLDMRVGYYRSNENKFWANHGISRLHPLSEILSQVKEFVEATNEIVILDFQEFPVGFGRGTDVHKQLAFFLFQHLEHDAVDSELTWDATLGDIWRTGKRIIVAYDHFGIVQNENQGFLWQSVRQRWGKVKDGAAQLVKFLEESRRNLTQDFQTARPFAEMAEMTPEAVDVLTNRYGGLRTMADTVNWQVSKLYRSSFGAGANIVAVDFYLETDIVQIAIDWNRKKFSDDV